MATNGKAPQTTRQVGDLAMPVLNIQGKAYAPVHQRVEAAHHAGGGPGTGYNVISCEWKEIYDIKCCEIWIEVAGNKFPGTAEVKNGFAYSIEDMQTSALGRALGFAGFEIKSAIASADDMEAVLRQRGQTTIVESEPQSIETLTPQRQILWAMAQKLNYNFEQFMELLDGFKFDGKVQLAEVKHHLENEMQDRLIPINE